MPVDRARAASIGGVASLPGHAEELIATEGGYIVHAHMGRIWLVLCAAATTVVAQQSTYTDETAFLNTVALQGYTATHEGFEDDLAWGSVRSTIVGGNQTAPSISNLGITWSSSSPNNDVTTGPGPARTGSWGYYSLPHGDYANGITDGFRGVGDQVIVAVGGWITTNSPPASIQIFLDGDFQNPPDFGGANTLEGPYEFFGVVRPAGFTVFDFRELEGTIGDQKFVFGDDFYFAFSGQIQDCNNNAVSDVLDINNQTSQDCNANLRPDECEIRADSPAPGGPYYCTQNCDPDCNTNGLLDACEGVAPVMNASGQLSPIGAGSPQTFTIVAPPTTVRDVILDFTAYGTLGGQPDHVAVDINGVPVGQAFGSTGSDCPEFQPDGDRIVVAAATFNAAVSGGDANINMLASAEVDPLGCDLSTYITVEATLFVPSVLDTDGNGLLDACEARIPSTSWQGFAAAAVLTVLAGAGVILRPLMKSDWPS